MAPSGYVFSPQDQGADDAVDSDADPVTGRTGADRPGYGETDLTWDAGLYLPAVRSGPGSDLPGAHAADLLCVQ